MAKSLDLPIQAVAGRTRFVADVQSLIAAGQLAHQLGNGIWRVLELAEVADLTVASGLGNRDRILQLGRVDPDECHTRFLHGSPSVQRGVIRPPGPSSLNRTVRRATSTAQRTCGLNLGHGRLLSWSMTPQVWHPMPWGRPPQQS